MESKGKITKSQLELQAKRGKEVSELKKTADDLLFSFLDKKRKLEDAKNLVQLLQNDIAKMKKDHSVIRRYEESTKKKIREAKFGKKELSEEQIAKRKEKNEKKKEKRKRKMETSEPGKEDPLERAIKKTKIRNLERETRLRQIMESGSRTEYVARSPRWEGNAGLFD